MSWEAALVAALRRTRGGMAGLGAGQQTPPPDLPEPGTQSVSLSPTSGSVLQNGTVAFVATVSRSGNTGVAPMTSGAATLSVEGLPSGVTVQSITPNPVALPSTTATITLAAAANATLVVGQTITVRSQIAGLPDATATYSLTTLLNDGSWRLSLRTPLPEIERPRNTSDVVAIDEYGRGTILDTTWNLAGQTGTTHVCTTEGQLRTAVANCVGGDRIVVAADIELTQGPLKLGAKTGTVYLVSDYINNGTFERRASVSDWGTLSVQGVVDEINACRARKTDTYRTLTCRSSTGVDSAAIERISRTGRWVVAGFRIRTNPAQPYVTNNFTGWLRLSDNAAYINTYAGLNGNLWIDRCHFTALPTQNIRVALALSGVEIALTNCCLDEIHCRASTGGRDHGINVGNGRWFKIVNNTIECHGIPLLFNGVGQPEPEMVPRDIETRFNHYVSPIGIIPEDGAAHANGPWASVTDYRSANLLESKGCYRWYAEGERLQNDRDPVAGFGITVNLQANSEEGTSHWVRTDNIVLRGLRSVNCWGPVQHIGAPAYPNPGWSRITNVTNATPRVVTTGTTVNKPAPEHGLITGDIVVIAGTGVVDGRWQVTVLSPTTFSLNGSTAGAAWVSGGYYAIQPRSDLLNVAVLDYIAQNWGASGTLPDRIPFFFNAKANTVVQLDGVSVSDNNGAKRVNGSMTLNRFTTPVDQGRVAKFIVRSAVLPHGPYWVRGNVDDGNTAYGSAGVEQFAAAPNVTWDDITLYGNPGDQQPNTFLGTCADTALRPSHTAVGFANAATGDLSIPTGPDAGRGANVAVWKPITDAVNVENYA